jgi:hypothetical protein
MHADFESLRRKYRPQKVKLLFVGESPPTSGRFFYNRDSGLYRAMLGAFRQVDSSIEDENFLEVFKQAGCYLTDACRTPVDRMTPDARRKACVAGEQPLAERIAELRPEMIVSLVRSIKTNVERAANRAPWNGILLNTPYPGRWVQHRRQFFEILGPHLRQLLGSCVSSVHGVKGIRPSRSRVLG